MATGPIAVFDSGVGGLSVLRHIRALLPHENLIYLADQAHVPYGGRPHEEIFQFGQAITKFFMVQQSKLIVVACNTASAAALTRLRFAFPEMSFVGMEPAVKPAAQQTKNNKVGVLATNGTFESTRYGRLMNQYAQDVIVWEDPCVGLVDLIEAGHIDTGETEQFLHRTLTPMLANRIDTLVLGCTHYPFVRPLISQIVGEQVTIIDPAPAIARQTYHIRQQQQQLASPTRPGQIQLLTTGDAELFAQLAWQLIGFEGDVGTAVW
ncbi:MAG: glutamate racemase, partial [Chloroflexi bacterium]|nr:glutamate racemase [Chloroflexota bacterium]